MVLITDTQKRTGAIISYITLAAQTLSTILVTPYFVKTLGKSEYGLYELVGSTVSYLSVLGLGLASAYIRFYSRYDKTKEEDKIAALNGLFMSVYSLMSLVCLVIGGLLIYRITWVFGSGIRSEDYDRAQIIMAILVIDMALKFPASIFTSYTSAHERFVFQKSLTLVETILIPTLRVFFVLGGYKSIGLAAAALCASLFELTVNGLYNFSKLHIRFDFRDLDKGLFKEIAIFTSFLFINQLYDILGGSKVDVFIIGRIRGTEEVTVYGVADKFVKIFYSVANPIAAVFVPQINRLVAAGNKIKEVNGIFVRVSKIQFVIQMLILSGFFLFGKEFIGVWMGEGYEVSYWIAFIIMAADIIALSQHIGIEIQRAMNKHKIRSIVMLFTNLGNIALTIPLTMKFGCIGAAFGTAICEIVGTVFFMNWYYKVHVGLDVKEFWKQIIKIVIFTIPLAGIFLYLKMNIATDSKLFVIFLAVLYMSVYFVGLYYILLTREERKMLIKKR